jgi:hypothetical protein
LIEDSKMNYSAAPDPDLADWLMDFKSGAAVCG